MMTASECSGKYQGFTTNVFHAARQGKKVQFVGNGKFYDAGVLEGVIKDLI